MNAKRRASAGVRKRAFCLRQYAYRWSPEGGAKARWRRILSTKTPTPETLPHRSLSGVRAFLGKKISCCLTSLRYSAARIRWRRVSYSRSGSTGLERWAFMPACRERYTSSSKALAVRAMMGTVLASGRSRARRARAASRPSITGMRTSISTAS